MLTKSFLPQTNVASLVSLQILVGISINRYFFAQMMSRAVHHDVIYHPFSINSQYLKDLGH